MKKVLAIVALSFLAIPALACDYVYCAAGDNNWYCQPNRDYSARGCIGSYGENFNGASLDPRNIAPNSRGLRYGYQQRPRRPYNNVGQQTWFFTADGYDWACLYTAMESNRCGGNDGDHGDHGGHHHGPHHE
jgi:hypothetical protein